MVLKILGLIWILLAGYLAGVATWLLFHRKSGAVRGLEPSDLLGQLICGAAVTGLIAFTLALSGAFSGLVFSGCVGGYLIAAMLAARPDSALLKDLLWSIPGALGRCRLVLLLAAACLAIFLMPFMNVFGFADETVYPNVAGFIERTGSVFQKDPVIPAVDEGHHEFFYKKFYEKVDGEKRLLYSIQEPGFYITDFASGTVTPQFFFFYPSMMAVFMAFLGTRGGFLILPFFAVLAVWALYHIAEDLMGRFAGTAAVLLLAVNFLEVYFAKYSTPEIVIQAFFLCGLYFFMRYRYRPEGGRPPAWNGFLSALCFGCMLLIHMESFFLLLPLFLVYAYYFAEGGIRGIADDRVFLLAFVPFCILTAALYFGPYNIYASEVFREYVGRVPGGGVTILCAFAAITAGALALRARGGRLLDIAAGKKDLIVRIACAGLVLLVCFSLFVRPLLWGQGAGPENIRPFKARYMVYLAYYLTPLGLLLAVAGYCMFMLRGMNSRNLLVPSSGLAYTAVFVYSPMVMPVFAYGMRRFVPVAVPLAVLMETYALYTIWRLDPGRSAGRVWPRRACRTAGALAGVALLAWSMLMTVHITKIKGFRESFPVVRQVSDLAADDGVVVCDKKSGRLLPAPLRAHLGRKAFRLQRHRYAADPWFEGFVRGFEARGVPVYLVVFPGSDVLEYTSGFRLTKIADVVFSGRALELGYEPSTRVVDFEIPMQVFGLHTGGGT